ncbi:MAG: threonylcarbamoyl-AMP synthase [Parachlamydia sp.]|nr:threonylcarbamoyl-AMP synthase [Parachlamydia sp.]
MRISLETAADLLRSGQVVAVPTETVYGLAASLEHPEAIRAIFSLKGRPTQNPLIVHLSDISQLGQFVETVPDSFQPLASAFWPGPVTFVLPILQTTIPAEARAGLPTAAFRIPSHPLILDLIQRTGPLLMPSANLSGRPSATLPEHIEADFGLSMPILDGGPAQKGVESTVLREHQGLWEIIRLGAVAPESFEQVLGYIPAVINATKGEKPVCPGQLFRHYAPSARLMPTTSFHADMRGAVVGFSDRQYPQGCSLISLGPSDAPEKVAENLYDTLRRLDREGIEDAWLDMRLPGGGLWQTIAERLFKAAQI